MTEPWIDPEATQVELGTYPSCLRGRPLDIQGGARKNFEINKFLLHSGEINIFTQAPCLSSVTQNVGRNILASRDREKKYFRVALT